MNVTGTNRATGRRKCSSAIVVLSAGSGKFTVNGREKDQYFLRETDRLIVMQPFKLTNTLNKYDVTVNVRGGGVTGQAGAVKHGISRVLASLDDAHKTMLRRNGFLTRDPREKERKKYGQKGARKRFQWTKR